MSITRWTWPQLFCVPMVRIDKGGSISVSHNVSADAIFIGCWTNISLPWMSPVNNNPTAAASATQQPRMVAGRYMLPASVCAAVMSVPAQAARPFRDRTIHQAHTAATNAPAVRNAPPIACETAACAVLLVNNATMLSNSARRVSGL
jgi:hypothetical protein